MTLVFLVFIFSPHVPPYNSMPFNKDCKFFFYLAKTTASSAYITINSDSSLILNILSRSAFILSMRSFINIMKRSGELGSPCFKPVCELKKL